MYLAPRSYRSFFIFSNRAIQFSLRRPLKTGAEKTCGLQFFLHPTNNRRPYIIQKHDGILPGLKKCLCVLSPCLHPDPRPCALRQDCSLLTEEAPEREQRTVQGLLFPLFPLCRARLCQEAPQEHHEGTRGPRRPTGR